jgi:polysaccharide biosynthesis transport protein
MELSAILRLMRRWWWLLGLLAVLAGGYRFIQLRSQPPVYEASTILQIGSALKEINPNLNFSLLSAQLAQNYSAVLKTFPVLEKTVNALQLPMTPDELSKVFVTSQLENTTFLLITVTYPDPVLAADIANELAKQLIDSSPTGLTDELRTQLEDLTTESENAKTQLRNYRDEVTAITSELEGNPTEERRKELEQRRDQLNTLITTSQSNLAMITGTISTLQQQRSSNVIEVTSNARIPTSPVSNNVLGNTILWTVAGAVLAVVIGITVEYLNDSVRDPSEVAAQLKSALLAVIPPFGRKGTYKDKLVAWSQPRSSFAEAYRALRVNLMFRATSATENHDNPHFIYIVTSPNPSEGKSITVANLAVTFANTGMRVLLVDADLRRATQHYIFDVPNTSGLTDLLGNSALGRGGGNMPTTVREADRAPEDYYHAQAKLLINTVTIKTKVPGLEFIPAGKAPANPAELLGSAQMQTLIGMFTADENYDVVIFDTPPSLTVADSIVLSNITKAEVIVVIEAGKTRRLAALRVVEQLIELHIPVAGVVLNRLNPRDATGYGGYYYYYGRYYGEDEADRKKPPSADGSNGNRPIPAIPTTPRTRQRQDTNDPTSHN